MIECKIDLILHDQQHSAKDHAGNQDQRQDRQKKAREQNIKGRHHR